MPQFETYHAFRDALFDAVRADGDALEHFWSALVADKQVPYVHDDQVAFLFRGEAFAVDWRGDFTNWKADDRTQGKRLENSDIWLLEMKFPRDARLDYKIVVDDETWIIDANNPHAQWSGFGENSSLMMPDYTPDPMTIYSPDVPTGTLEAHTLESSYMGYAIRFDVYTPANVSADKALPTLYTTDGHEYNNQRLGAISNVLDNLLQDGAITPIRLVLVDPRDIDNIYYNRRRDEYIANDHYRQFFAEELVSFVDSHYKTVATPDARILLGTSLGGVFATYTGFHHPDIFGNLAIQSPAYKYQRAIYRLVRQQDFAPNLKIWLSSGVPKWDGDSNRMVDLLREKGYALKFVEVNQGHSWGQWRDQLSDIFRHFVASA